MLDNKLIRNNPEIVREAMIKRKEELNLEYYLNLDIRRRELLSEVEILKNQRNITTQEIAKLKASKIDAEDLVAKMRGVSDEIKELDLSVKNIDMEMQDMLFKMPNIPDDAVPLGDTDASNIEVRSWGTPREFDFPIKPHWDIGEHLDILDFASASKVSGSRFVFYKGLGAKLERALINLMLDLHTLEHGYEEVFPPFLVARRSMLGTGQLPKFEQDAFKIANDDLFLVPTAEVPVTNMFADSILDNETLPIRYAAYSACFRAEAGAAGKDTRGLIRQHQFNKVELVKFTRPEDSSNELEKLLNDAEAVLKILELPYRVVLVCVGDLGFAASKKYDLEVWLPSYGKYVEISSCSNFKDFQARRANIKYRPASGEKAEFIHTINGSGLAIGRTLAAILENCQTENGKLKLPKALKSYLRLSEQDKAIICE